MTDGFLVGKLEVFTVTLTDDLPADIYQQVKDVCYRASTKYRTVGARTRARGREWVFYAEDSDQGDQDVQEALALLRRILPNPSIWGIEIRMVDDVEDQAADVHRARAGLGSGVHRARDGLDPGWPHPDSDIARELASGRRQPHPDRGIETFIAEHDLETYRDLYEQRHD